MFLVKTRPLRRVDPSEDWFKLIVCSFMGVLLGFFLVYIGAENSIPFILGIWLIFGCILIAGAVRISNQTQHEYQCRNCGSSKASLQRERKAEGTVSPPSSSLATSLTSRKNRGYVTAGLAAIVGLIAFFGSYGLFGWDWLEVVGALVVLVASVILIFRDHVYGPLSLLMEKPIKYVRYGVIGGGMVALLIHLLYLFAFLGESRSFSSDFIIGLGYGYWLFLLAAIAMSVGGVIAWQERASLRSLLTLFVGGMIAVITAALLLLLILLPAILHL